MAYNPDQVASAYNFPQGRLLNQQTIAFIELGGAVDLPALQNYCLAKNYPFPKVTIQAIDGVVPSLTGTSGADGEVDLDLNVAVGVAQGCGLLIVFAPNTAQGFVDAVMAAANSPLNPCAVSISWGMPISLWSDSDRENMDQAIAYAQSKKIQVFVASGDNGSNDGTDSSIVDYPAASPYAIGCGGTNLVLNSSNQIISQSAWSLSEDNGQDGASGGGVTILYSKPSWQTGFGPAGRCVPDVAGNADPQTGYNVDVDGTSMVIGGTSAVAPLYASLCAIITSRLGQMVDNWQSSIYSGNVTLDVVGGDNGAFSCIVGYDMVTGMGSIDGTKMLNQLANSNNLTILDPLPPVITAQPVPSNSWWEKLLLFFQNLIPQAKAAKFAVKHVK